MTSYSYDEASKLLSDPSGGSGESGGAQANLSARFGSGGAGAIFTPRSPAVSRRHTIPAAAAAAAADDGVSLREKAAAKAAAAAAAAEAPAAAAAVSGGQRAHSTAIAAFAASAGLSPAKAAAEIEKYDRVAAAVHTFHLEGVEDEATLREAIASMVMAGEGIDNEQWHDLVAEFGGLAGLTAAMKQLRQRKSIRRDLRTAAAASGKGDRGSGGGGGSSGGDGGRSGGGSGGSGGGSGAFTWILFAAATGGAAAGPGSYCMPRRRMRVSPYSRKFKTWRAISVRMILLASSYHAC
jgi:hypothetical protein